MKKAPMAVRCAELWPMSTNRLCLLFIIFLSPPSPSSSSSLPHTGHEARTGPLCPHHIPHRQAQTISSLSVPHLPSPRGTQVCSCLYVQGPVPPWCVPTGVCLVCKVCSVHSSVHTQLSVVTLHCRAVSTHPENHRSTDWGGLERTLRVIQFQPPAVGRGTSH